MSRHIARYRANIIQDSVSLEYELIAVICHKGFNLKDGHFWTYSKRWLDKEAWDRANYRFQEQYEEIENDEEVPVNK